MKRVFAILLTMLVSFPLILPAFVSNAKTNLPACCRKDGKHGCGMKNMASQQLSDPTQPAVSSAKAKCPFYPSSQSGPSNAPVFEQSSAPLFFAEALSHPALHAQTEARYRISFTRACQKRGPPTVQA